jgi:hypothetical protein
MENTANKPGFAKVISWLTNSNPVAQLALTYSLIGFYELRFMRRLTVHMAGDLF